MRSKFFGIAIMSIAISGCGGGGGALPVTLGPTTVTKNNLTNVVGTVGNATIVASGLPGGAATYTSTPALNNGPFAAYSRTVGGTIYIVYLAQDSGVEASFGGEVNNAGKGVRGTVIKRTATLVLPTTGTASYNGSYAGIVQTTATNDSFAVSGNVNIQANFATNRVNGTITNRNSGATPFAAVTLSPSTLDTSGRYAGSASNTLGTTGTYAGILAGGSANQTAGVLELNTAGGVSRETGAFIARR